MATQVKGARANKPNDSFGVMDNPSVYRNKYREDVYKDDDDEVEANAEQDGTSQEATQQQEGFVETKQGESSEHDYKKRYDDLKKHYDNKLQEWKSEKEAIKTTAQQMDLDPSIKLPKSPDELEEFKSKYPDVYAVVQTVAAMQAQEQSEGLKRELETIRGREKDMEVQSAYKVLTASHPDFNEIRNDEKFLLWLDDQPTSLSEGITKNNTDSKWAIRVLDLYKADTGLKTKSNKSNSSAAESVRTPSSREVPTDKNSGKKIWKMQDIAKMKSWEFEKLEKEIDLARAEGRIIQ
jgi:hypothetical protein